jgi:hypothetical protein
MLVQAVLTRIRQDYPEDTILTTPEDIFSSNYQPGGTTHVLFHGELPTFDDIAMERWYHLYLASLGARFWYEQEGNVSEPTRAGIIDRSAAGINKIVVDAVFASNRAAAFKMSGVNYIGRTFGDPRTAILVDYKRDKTHNPSNDSYIHALLTALPVDKWATEEPHDWGTFAIISTSNVNSLETFLDDLSETNILAYSTGAVAKLNFIGRDFGHIGTPRPNAKYGLEIRETASRMRPKF